MEQKDHQTAFAANIQREKGDAMRQIDVHKIADEAKFNGFHALVLFWCALIIIFDGYDLAVAGIALPSIMKEMGVDPTRPVSWSVRLCSA